MKNLVGHKVKCDICPEMFSNETKLKINMDIQKFQIQMKPETQDKFECEICNRVFKTDHGRKIYAIKVHTSDHGNDIKCETCDFISKSDKVMKKHMKMHRRDIKRSSSIMKQPVNQYTCRICGFT